MAKSISLLKRVFVGLGSFFVLRPGKSFLRLFFYRVIVKGYSAYYSIIRKLGWKGRNSHGFKVEKELTHFFAICLTVGFVSFNLFGNAKIQDGAEFINKTILASLVTSEFGAIESVQIIEEFYDDNLAMAQVVNNYNDPTSFKAQLTAEMKPSETNDLELAELNINYDPTFIRPGMNGQTSSVIARRDIIDYSVEPGDTISTIAEKFDIGVSTILWENDLSAYSVIRPGDVLRILPVSGVTHKVARGESLTALANKYDISEEDIVKANDLVSGQKLSMGQKLVIPGGKKDQFAKYQPKTYSGFSVVKDIIKPVSSFVKPKGAAKAPSTGNKMVWPTVGYRITQYFSWRHLGLDVANKIGTPLYASDAGVVESSGWGNGYGNNVLVNHGGGKKTRYAHLSKIYVKKGEKVVKGEQVGAMGSTGWSTGSHIHFEVIINGTKYNPLNYVK